MIERWWSEAGKYNVLPLDDRGTGRAVEQISVNRPLTIGDVLPGSHANAAQQHAEFSQSLLQPDRRRRDPSERGGGRAAWRSADGLPASVSSCKTIDCNSSTTSWVWSGTTSRRPKRLPAGAAKLRMEFTNTGDNKGVAALFVNDRKVGEGPIARTVPLSFNLSEGLTAGRDPSTPVTESYQSPFPFTGKLKKVVFQVKEEPKTAVK